MGFFAMNVLKTIGTALYWARLDKEMSIKDVALETGLDPRTISNIEKGRAWPQGETGDRLKKFYPGVLDDLI